MEENNGGVDRDGVCFSSIACVCCVDCLARHLLPTTSGEVDASGGDVEAVSEFRGGRWIEEVVQLDIEGCARCECFSHPEGRLGGCVVSAIPAVLLEESSAIFAEDEEVLLCRSDSATGESDRFHLECCGGVTHSDIDC